MYFQEMVDQVLDLSGADAGDDFEAMVKAALNRVSRHLLNTVDADQERREFSYTLPANTRQGGLPLLVKQVLNIDDATNLKRVYDISAREFDVLHPGTTTTGDPDKAYPMGEFGVQVQPSSAENVRIKSSSASDAGSNFNVRVTGEVSGVLVTEKIQLNGTTNVNSTNTYDASRLERVTKVSASGTAWTGYLTLSGLHLGQPLLPSLSGLALQRIYGMSSGHSLLPTGRIPSVLSCGSQISLMTKIGPKSLMNSITSLSGVRQQR